MGKVEGDSISSLWGYFGSIFQLGGSFWVLLGTMVVLSCGNSVNAHGILAEVADNFFSNIVKVSHHLAAGSIQR